MKQVGNTPSGILPPICRRISNNPVPFMRDGTTAPFVEGIPFGSGYCIFQSETWRNGRSFELFFYFTDDLGVLNQLAGAINGTDTFLGWTGGECYNFVLKPTLFLWFEV